MKKINNMIDYTKLVIVLFLFLLGSSEFLTPAFFVFLALTTVAIGAEVFLVRERKKLYARILVTRLVKAGENKMRIDREVAA